MTTFLDNLWHFSSVRLKQLSVSLLAASFCAPVLAATATATATANITSTLTVRTINGLVFGDLSSGPEAGTLVLSPGGVRTTTGGVAFNSAVPGSPAAFDVQGDPNSSYSVTFPAAIVMTNGSPNSMVVSSVCRAGINIPSSGCPG